MNINRRLRDGVTTVTLTAVERRRLLDAQSILDTAGRVLNNEQLTALAKQLGVAESLLDREAAKQKE